MPVAYRPFDERYLNYEPELLARARFEFMRHLRGMKNRALIALRRPRNDKVGNFFVCDSPPDKCVISSLDNAQTFPLYLFEGDEKKGSGKVGTMMLMFEPAAGYTARRANLAPSLMKDLTTRLGLKWLPVDRGDLKNTLGPEDVFDYAYGVFHSPTYRTRYAEFLKIDFPRLPLTSDLELFRALAGKGDRDGSAWVERFRALGTKLSVRVE
jgi:predicted helicase